MRKRTIRKIWSLVNPIAHAIEGAAMPQGSRLDTLRTRELTSIEAFRTGAATLQEWSDIVAMLNLAEVMAKDGIGPEVLEVCDKVQECMLEAAKRHKATGRMGLTGEGLQAVRELYEFHDLQRTSISLSEYSRLIKKTADKSRNKANDVSQRLSMT